MNDCISGSIKGFSLYEIYYINDYWLHEWLHKWFYKGFFPVWNILYKWLHVRFSPLLGLFPISMGWLHEWFSPYINNLVYWRSRSWLWNWYEKPFLGNQPLTRDYVPGTGCFWLELELVRNSLTVGISLLLETMYHNNWSPCWK